jgi:hypothetical protein
MRPVLKMPLLQEESAAVRTTKLTMPAAVASPICLNTATNGLSAGDSWSHGMRAMITTSAPM